MKVSVINKDEEFKNYSLNKNNISFKATPRKILKALERVSIFRKGDSSRWRGAVDSDVTSNMLHHNLIPLIRDLDMIRRKLPKKMELRLVELPKSIPEKLGSLTGNRIKFERALSLLKMPTLLTPDGTYCKTLMAILRKQGISKPDRITLNPPLRNKVKRVFMTVITAISSALPKAKKS